MPIGIPYQSSVDKFGNRSVSWHLSARHQSRDLERDGALSTRPSAGSGNCSWAAPCRLTIKLTRKACARSKMGEGEILGANCVRGSGLTSVMVKQVDKAPDMHI